MRIAEKIAKISYLTVVPYLKKLRFEQSIQNPVKLKGKRCPRNIDISPVSFWFIGYFLKISQLAAGEGCYLYLPLPATLGIRYARASFPSAPKSERQQSSEIILVFKGMGNFFLRLVSFPKCTFKGK